MPPFSILAFGCLALAAHMAPVRLTHWATRSTPLMLRQRPVARRSKVLRKKPVEPSLEKDKHLYFDRVELTVQGGHGGDGAVIRPDQEGLSAQAMERSEVVMPPGGNGGGVLLYVDPSLTDLLHLRVRLRHRARTASKVRLCLNLSYVGRSRWWTTGTAVYSQPS